MIEGLADRCNSSGLHHFEGVSWHNAALINLAAGKLDRANECARAAIHALSTTSSSELAAAKSADKQIEKILNG